MNFTCLEISFSALAAIPTTMNDPPRTPLIKKGDELIFQTREMKTEELEWKYITSKKAMFAIFPAVNFTNPVGTVRSVCHS